MSAYRAGRPRSCQAGKRAIEWRIAFYRCDVSGDLPNKSWPAHDDPSALSTPTAKGQPRKHKHPNPRVTTPRPAKSFNATLPMPSNPPTPTDDRFASVLSRLRLISGIDPSVGI
jgi:hypothetical protein